MEEGLLKFVPVLDNPKLVPKTVYNAINKLVETCNRRDFYVAEIDPLYVGGVDLCNRYKIGIEKGANCLIVNGIRSKKKKFAACLVPVGYRYDMSGIVRRVLNARQVSVAPLDFVLRKTKMECGSITPIGIPKEWMIFIDPLVLKQNMIVIGGGLVKSKLLIPSAALLELPNASILDGLAKTN